MRASGCSATPPISVPASASLARRRRGRGRSLPSRCSSTPPSGATSRRASFSAPSCWRPSPPTSTAPPGWWSTARSPRRWSRAAPGSCGQWSTCRRPAAGTSTSSRWISAGDRPASGGYWPTICARPPARGMRWRTGWRSVARSAACRRSSTCIATRPSSPLSATGWRRCASAPIRASGSSRRAASRRAMPSRRISPAILASCWSRAPTSPR